MLLNLLFGVVIIGITVCIQGFGTSFWINHLIKSNKDLKDYEKNTRFPSYIHKCKHQKTIFKKQKYSKQVLQLKHHVQQSQITL